MCIVKSGEVCIIKKMKWEIGHIINNEKWARHNFGNGKLGI